jgi:hypothetical protein
MTMTQSSSRGSWLALNQELDQWRRAGLTARFWARDDDAIALTPQLDRLIAIAKAVNVEIGLAVIPARLTEALADYLHSGESPFYPMCHGWRHVNYGAPDNPSEFGPERALAQLRDDAKSAFESFSRRFEAVEAIFVPPFARISPALLAELPSFGFCGVSTGPTTGERRYARLSSLVSLRLPLRRSPVRRPMHYDVHIDPFEWRAGQARSAQSIERETVGYLRARRIGYIPSDWPIGVLMHHLTFDEGTWRVCNDLLQVLASHPAVGWPSVKSMIERVPPGDAPARQVAEAE